MRPATVIDVHKEMMRVTLDIISQCMFSANVMNDLDTMGPHAVDIAVNYAFQRLQNPFALPKGWPTRRNRQFKKVMESLDALVYRLIAERRAGNRRTTCSTCCFRRRTRKPAKG